MAARALADDAVVDADADLAVMEEDPSLQDATRDAGDDVTLFAGEARGLDTSPILADPARAEGDPEGPPVSVYGRRGRLVDAARVEADLLRSRLDSVQGDLADATRRLARETRDREVLEVMMRSSPQRDAAPPPESGARGAQNGGKAVMPREYSPKGGVGPAKWLFHIEMYFECTLIFGDDRVKYGAVHLRDAAEAWWRSHVVDTTTADGVPAVGRIITWDEFKKRLSQTFTPIPEREYAREKLYALRQLGSVQSHTQAYRELIFVLDDLGTSEAKTLYLRGLKPPILKEVCVRFPNTVEEAIVIAEQMERMVQGASMPAPFPGTGGRPASRAWMTGGGPGSRRFRPAGAVVHAAGAGQVNAQGAQPGGARAGANAAGVQPQQRRAGGPRPRTDLDAQRERLKREGKCFSYEQTGHISRDCPGNAQRRRG